MQSSEYRIRALALLGHARDMLSNQEHIIDMVGLDDEMALATERVLSRAVRDVGNVMATIKAHGAKAD